MKLRLVKSSRASEGNVNSKHVYVRATISPKALQEQGLSVGALSIANWKMCDVEYIMDKDVYEVRFVPNV